MKEYIKELQNITIKSLEEQAGMPKKTLDHFVAGRRELPKKYIPALKKILKKYGYKE